MLYFYMSFDIELHKEYEKLVLAKRVTFSQFVEKKNNNNKKERKCPLNKTCMLIFQMQKTSAISQNLI